MVMVITVRLPDPDGVKPVTVPALATPVHAYVVPATFEVHVTAMVLVPEQIAWDSVLFVTVGVGLIVTVKLLGVPAQPL